jgi:hypothetical protein
MTARCAARADCTVEIRRHAERFCVGHDIWCISTHDVRCACGFVSACTGLPEARRVLRLHRGTRSWTEPRRSRLMHLASFWWVTKDLTRASTDILLAAYIEVEQRLIAIASTTTNHRGRCNARWLGKWSSRIDKELARRGSTINTRRSL